MTIAQGQGCLVPEMIALGWKVCIMRSEVKEAFRGWADKYLTGGKVVALSVLEIGSLDVNGNLRDVFSKQSYTGLDMQSGPNVDVVADAHHLMRRFARGAFDVVVYSDTIEHDDAFWLTLDQIHKAVKHGGLFFVSLPTIEFQVFHQHPDDYWRFTPSAFDKIILNPKRYTVLERLEISTGTLVDTLAGVGRKK